MIYFIGSIYIASLIGFALSVIAGGLELIGFDICILAGVVQFVTGYLAAGYIDARERAEEC
jgi:hypothetical protein